ncbi:NINE protein [Myxosarcina sp. GI1]|uniref:NINE protein n=1 Tax=Myxosarcina sp. GI1 TaxID=1541065 RepID=UPI0005698A03|nr:NINE protein [Myxosarcina sp. GI1]
MSLLDKLDKLFQHRKERRIAAILALSGTILPIAGLHKIYLGQPLWGVIYLLLWSTPIPRIASAIDAVWYLVQDSEQFQLQFSGNSNRKLNTNDTQQISTVAGAIRELERLRQDGLVSEYEFEQKRRKLLDRIV